MSRIFSPSDMPDARGGSESPIELSSESSSDSESREPGANRPSASTSQTKRRKYVRDPLQRKKILEDDIWTTNVTVTSVDCRGCGKTLALDGRRQYYLGLWEKHRVKCAGIRRQKGEEPLPRKPRKTATKRDGEASTSKTFDGEQGRQVAFPEPAEFGSNTASTPSAPRDYSTQYRASSADYPDEKHSDEPHHLPASRSMGSLRAGGPEQPGNEWYWRETPFAPPISNESSRGRAVYRYSTRWELANGFGKYPVDTINTSEEPAGGANTRVD